MRANRRQVSQIALREMVEVTVGDRGPLVRGAARALLRLPAAVLARALVALDRDLAQRSLRRAALAMLRRYGVNARVEGPGLRLSPLGWATAPIPARGPLLVVANHPGLFDALALFAAIGRDDLTVLATQRHLLAA